MDTTRKAYRLGWTDALIFVLLLLCTVYTFPRWADPNQNSRLDLVVAVVDQGTLRIDDYVDNTVDYAKFEGHYYSDKAPGAAFLGIPVYAAMKSVLSLPVMDGLMDYLAHNQALAATLRLYRDIEKAKCDIPLVQLISTSVENLKSRAERLAPQLAATSPVAHAEPIELTAYLGGSAVPAQALPSWGIAVTPEGMAVERMVAKLRGGVVPVIARVETDRVLLHLRSVVARQDVELVEVFASLEND